MKSANAATEHWHTHTHKYPTASCAVPELFFAHVPLLMSFCAICPNEMVARATRVKRRNGGLCQSAVFFPLSLLLSLTIYASPSAMIAPGKAWNFAFGSNMDISTRNRRQLEVSQIQPAVADGWELHFSLPGIPYIEPGFAALRPSNVSTHGLCLELDRESWLRLLVSEGVR